MQAIYLISRFAGRHIAPPTPALQMRFHRCVSAPTLKPPVTCRAHLHYTSNFFASFFHGNRSAFLRPSLNNSLHDQLKRKVRLRENIPRLRSDRFCEIIICEKCHDVKSSRVVCGLLVDVVFLPRLTKVKGTRRRRGALSAANATCPSRNVARMPPSCAWRRN